MDIVYYLILAICIYVIGIIIKSLLQGLQSLSWTTTQGTILSSEIIEKDDIDDNTTSYIPKISYEYIAIGEKYTNDLITFKGITVSLKNATSIIENILSAAE